ncbi:MAG: pitrilysin family protein [Bdellovibrionales bacterium]|nr:pitrilysin family protein [Bdellovibrionales bacterium]
MSKSEVDYYKPYSFSKKTLSNGLEVLLVKDTALPYISFDMMFRSGSRMDPADKEGLMALLTEVIDKGTKKLSAVQVAENIEVLGTSFLYSLNKDALFFSVETLSWLDEKALEIFSQIITQPSFLEQEFQRAKEKAIGWVKRSGEDFSSYSSRVFNKYLYESHPYGFYQNGSLGSLKEISGGDIKKRYDEYFYPHNALFSISGQYSDDIIEKLEKFLGKWKAPSGVSETSSKKNIDISLVPSVKRKELLIINHPAAIQSEIRMGHISVNSSHPDYLSLKTANVILGGSFNSRLMKRIRVQKGLTYGISSAFSAKKELGAFKIGLAVRNDKVGSALLEIMGVLEDFHKNGLTAEELEKAKQLLKNQFITRVSTADSFAHYLMYLNSQDISYSYAKEYFVKLTSLSLDTVNEAVSKHLHPDQMKVLILTNVDKVKSQLRDFEPFTVKDYKTFL